MSSVILILEDSDTEQLMFDDDSPFSLQVDDSSESQIQDSKLYRVRSEFLESWFWVNSEAR